MAGQPVMIACRCSSSVSRATLMSARDTRHNIYIYIYIYTVYIVYKNIYILTVEI